MKNNYFKQTFFSLSMLLLSTIGHCDSGADLIPGQPATISGLAGTGTIIILALGIFLLLLEIFIIPGFGVSGIMGILLLAFGIYLIVGNFIQSLLIMVPIIIILMAAIVYMMLNLHKSWLGKKIILSTSEKSHEGFVSPTEPDHLLGKSGIAISALRPSGRASIDGIDYNVMAQGVFVEPGSSLEVIKVTGSNIYVKKINKGDS